MKYTAADFNIEDEPVEMVQYVIDNVEDFGERYHKALTKVDRMRCPLSRSDSELYDEICDMVDDWCEDNGEDADEYDVEEIFC